MLIFHSKSGVVCGTRETEDVCSNAVLKTTDVISEEVAAIRWGSGPPERHGRSGQQVGVESNGAADILCSYLSSTHTPSATLTCTK